MLPLVFLEFLNGIKEFCRASIERPRRKNELIILRAAPRVPFGDGKERKTVLESYKVTDHPQHILPHRYVTQHTYMTLRSLSIIIGKISTLHGALGGVGQKTDRIYC